MLMTVEFALSRRDDQAIEEANGLGHHGSAGVWAKFVQGLRLRPVESTLGSDRLAGPEKRNDVPLDLLEHVAQRRRNAL